jgi:glycosyltransferase involved in cell wall biosynthesis
VFEKIHTRRVYATALKVLLRLHPKMTIYDIDDADYLKFPPKNIYHFMKNCSACTVGSAALAKFTNELNKTVLLLTSPVIAHAEVKAARNSIFTIGWVGYYNAHRESLLQLLFPSLKNLSFLIKLILLGVTKPQNFAEVNEYFNCAAHVTIEMPQNINWHDEQALYSKISTFDIGVAPLLPTSINKAKSAFKVKQYLSCGVPVLGSGFGENEQFLNHGVNGFVCNDSSSYAEYIRLVAAMADDTYASMSENAFRSREAFSMKNYCSTFISYLNKGIQAAEPTLTE